MKKFFLLLLILYSTLLGQLTSITEFPVQDKQFSSEQSAMINAADGTLCFFWVEENWAFSELMYSKSTDFGETWIDTKHLARNIESSYGPPEIAAYTLSTGRILVALKARTYHLIYSDDNGETWSEQAELPAGNAVRAPSYSYPGFVELSTGEIWFHYSPAKVRSAQAHTTFYIQSEDGIDWHSKTETSGDTLFTTKPNLSMSASIVATGENNLLLAYQELSDGYYKLISRTSINNGITWSDPVILAEGDSNFENPQLVKGDGNTVWLVYQEDAQTGIDTLVTTDIYYTKSVDSGNTWESAEKFTSYSGYDTYPSGVEVEGILLLAFGTLRDAKFDYDNENYQGPIYHEELQSQIYFGFAGEAPDIFTPPVILSEVLEIEGNYPNYKLQFNAQLVHENISSVSVSYSIDSEEYINLELKDSGENGDEVAGDFIFSTDFESVEVYNSISYMLTAVSSNGSKAISTMFFPSPPVPSSHTYLMDINNIKLSFSSEGVLADAWVTQPDGTEDAYGTYMGDVFLYSGGFFLSGIDENEKVWTNAVATASRIVDYVTGPASETTGDWSLGIYSVRAKDEPFGTSWQRWKIPAENGAWFYDGDNDDSYNPIDKNGNGEWDKDEDRPVIIGDEAAWCVYHDGVPSENRRFQGVGPLGIEISQTVFAYDSKEFPQMADVVFIRYLVKNSGLHQNQLDSVIFSAWADPDILDYTDDYLGSDIDLKAGFCYDKTGTSPAYFVSIVQGPQAYVPGRSYTDVNNNGEYDNGTDIPLDTAYTMHGPLLGKKMFAGAMDTGMSGFFQYMGSHPTHGDPMNEYHARNYALNRNVDGEPVDPCEFVFGEVVGGIDCATLDPNFMYSGDPVEQTGWINIEGLDQRMFVNSGPFQLKAGESVDIIVAYAVSKGENSLSSITETRKTLRDVHGFYGTNFTEVPVGVEEEVYTALPVKFHLAQNYPNPFNPATTIEYSIPVSSRQLAVDSPQSAVPGSGDQSVNQSINQSGNEFVRLKVFDILGREVATLVNKPQAPGNYKVKFDAGDFSSGIYLYRLQYGSLIQSKKMVFLK